mmetsp:Transcript_61796/g.180596  ORF Transcript_61796/g.180596 Transcript_61796/m.180596 type:complete len:255 (+) Transcript_61796:2521-3285(+)
MSGRNKAHSSATNITPWKALVLFKARQRGAAFRRRTPQSRQQREHFVFGWCSPLLLEAPRERLLMPLALSLFRPLRKLPADIMEVLSFTESLMFRGGGEDVLVLPATFWCRPSSDSRCSPFRLLRLKSLTDGDMLLWPPLEPTEGRTLSPLLPALPEPRASGSGTTRNENRPLLLMLLLLRTLCGFRGRELLGALPEEVREPRSSRLLGSWWRGRMGMLPDSSRCSALRPAADAQRRDLPGAIGLRWQVPAGPP